MALIKRIDLTVLGDARGKLISLEAGFNVPFEIERVYYIFDTRSGVVRGLHAHRELQQVIVAVKGSCRFTLDDGHNRQDIILNHPSQGLHLAGLIWREMHDFSEDCVLMVLASAHYDESDYIRDYDDFLNEVN